MYDEKRMSELCNVSRGLGARREKFLCYWCAKSRVSSLASCQRPEVECVCFSQDRGKAVKRKLDQKVFVLVQVLFSYDFEIKFEEFVVENDIKPKCLVQATSVEGIHNE